MDRDSECMDLFDFELDDVVIFELPTLSAVEAFRVRFRPRYDGWSDADEDGWLFTTRLAEEDDFAVLFRDVEELVTDLDLGAIRFWLDGRVYVLVATEPLRSLAA
jgi:hypothetical protein